MNDYTTIIDNQSDNNWDEAQEGPSLSTRIAFASAWVIIAVAGIIGRVFFCWENCLENFFSFLGNSLVIFVAVRFQKMNNVTNCFIVNCKLVELKKYYLYVLILVAITDIVFLAFCMPLLVVQYTSDHW
jgi:hypothetical protein